MLSVHTCILSYGCTWEVWRTFKKLELPSAAPQPTLTFLSCSPNFPKAFITRYTHAKHDTIILLLNRHTGIIKVYAELLTETGLEMCPKTFVSFTV